MAVSRLSEEGLGKRGWGRGWGRDRGRGVGEGGRGRGIWVGEVGFRCHDVVCMFILFSKIV